jgi:CheY-like chemotaxis protein
MTLDELRHQVCEANRALPASGLVRLTWGNVSGIDHASGLWAIKPSGVDYDQLTPADVVVLDLGLPTMPGIEVLRRLRESGSASVPVIVVSGASERMLKHGRELLHPGAWMEKPLRPAELVAAVEAAALAQDAAASDLQHSRGDGRIGEHPPRARRAAARAGQPGGARLAPRAAADPQGAG